MERRLTSHLTAGRDALRYVEGQHNYVSALGLASLITPGERDLVSVASSSGTEHYWVSALNLATALEVQLADLVRAQLREGTLSAAQVAALGREILAIAGTP
jgi:hypothetical protein